MGITGVFLHETFRVANSDDALITAQRVRSEASHVKKFQRLFAKADLDHDNALSFDEFESALSSAGVITWLAAMDMDIRDLKLVFEMLDDGDGKLTPEELVAGAQ